MHARVVSIHAGKVREWASGPGAPWRSAIVKEALAGEAHIGADGIEGDQVANRKHHGGTYKAVLAYPSEHYPTWRDELGLSLVPGQFGENLSIEGLCEGDVCIGDVYALGEAVLQVTQPREPCHTLARQWQCPTLVEAVWQSGRGGWYLRVLKPGRVQANRVLDLQERRHPGWSVLRVLRALQGDDRREQGSASELECLSPKWQEKLARKALGGAEGV